MRLVKVRLHGYRRFEDQTPIDVDEDVIALVGPNEAGKSSILQALLHLNSSGAFARAELSRDLPHDDERAVVWSLWLLEADDIAAIKAAGIKSPPKYAHVLKRGDGNLRVRLDPPVRRDPSLRLKLLKTFEQLRANSTVTASLSEAGLSSDRLQEAQSAIESAIQDLSGEAANQLEGLSSALEEAVDEGMPQYARTLPERLRAFIVAMDGPSPSRLAVEVLSKRRPRFLFFGEEDRALRSEYDLDELESGVPHALSNLAELAGLDIADVVTAAREENFGRVAFLEEQANTKLREIFEQSWHRGVTVHLRVDSTSIQVLVSNEGGGYSSVDDRSDGLRWFVALLTYTSLSEDVDRPPILLVDEAETHLHYDAQAAMVRMFSAQQAAAKVIYTTHSAGCLPEDIGCGVRVVAPIAGREISTVRWFWEDGAGATPLLIGMGSSTFAFTPARYAVIAEGPSDAMLLPSLLREAVGTDRLDFQVVPGLASIAPTAVPDLDLEAAHVAYLVDSDDGGDAIREKLIQAGVPADLIIELRMPRRRGLVLEDFIDADTYAAAVNEEVRRWSPAAEALPTTSLPRRGRPRFVDGWCSERDLRLPARRGVALRLLEQSRDTRLVDQSRVESLRAVHAALVRALGLTSS